jgi:hypothetical protein
MSAIGSSTVQFLPSSIYTFSDDYADTVSVRDTTAGIFSVKAELTSDPTKQGTSSSIEILPASLRYLQLRSRAGNKGIVLSNEDSTITSSDAILFNSAGFDQFNNYIDDIDSTEWNSTGTLNPSITLPTSGSSYTFSPAGTGIGRIDISIPGNGSVLTDTSGILTVNPSNLSYILIQLDSTDGGLIADSRSLSSGDSLRLYSVGYDNKNNWMGLIDSDWSINNPTIGFFENGLATINNQNQVLFTADKIGNGVINASVTGSPGIGSQTGLFTIVGGPSSYLLIRNAANNSGYVFRDTSLTLSADTTISLFAAFYDASDNYLGDSVVTWFNDGLTGGPNGQTSASIVFSPSLVGSGFIYTQSSIEDDTTGTFTIVPGNLASIRIQDGPTGSSNEVGSMILTAGSDTALYSGGYDSDGNFISLVFSNWTFEGDSIGNFSNSNPVVSNTFNAINTGSAVIRVVENGGVLTDITSTITVLPGDPAFITKVVGSDSQTTSAGTQLPRDIQVQVFDQFMNPVGGDTVRFLPIPDAAVNVTNAITNSLGIASTGWTVHTDTLKDSLFATVPNETTTPDTLIFIAFVNPGAAETMNAVSALNDSGQVDSDLSTIFSVRVVDASNNPVPNIPISFSIVQRPSGASGDFLSVYSASTDISGIASSRLHLGNKIGEYIVRAFSSSTTPSFIEFTGKAIQPASPDSIIIFAGNNQTSIVDQVLPDSIIFKVTDQYGNPNPGVTVTLAPSGGNLSPGSGSTNAEGLFSTSWRLGQTSGQYTLRASLLGFPLVRSDTVWATASPDAASKILLVSMRQTVSDSIAAVPGESIIFSVEVLDQFNNTVPNSSVRFQSLPGYNAVFEASQLTSDLAGKVSNVVETDAENTETFFRALIAGIDTLDLHIFHLLYVDNSLQDAFVSPGDTVAFQLNVQNASPFPVSLHQQNTLFRFNDGLHFFSAELAGPVTLPALGSETLVFTATQLNPLFATTSYTPVLTLNGALQDSLLSGKISLPSNSLTLFRAVISEVIASQSKVARGDSFLATMRVSNQGPEIIDINSLQTLIYFSPAIPGVAVLPSLSNPTQLPPNSPNTSLDFQIIIPANSALGKYEVNGRFTGTTPGGSPVFIGTALSTDSIMVVNAAEIAVLNLSPSVLTRTDSFVFQATLQNSGDVGIILNPDSTYLSFGIDTIPISQSYSIPANGMAQLSFIQSQINSAAQPISYDTKLRLYGEEALTPFDTSISINSSILVQDPPQLVITFLKVSPDSVSQNQDSIRVQLILENQGLLNATARISKRDSVRINTNNLVGIIPSDEEIFNFPVEIAAGESFGTLDFYYSIDENYSIGVDTIRANYSFADSNSGKNYQSFPPDFDTHLVISRARLMLTQHSLSPDTVVQGQNGIQLNFAVRNSGESPAIVDSNDLLVNFRYLHSINLISPVLPVTLVSGDTQQFEYLVDIDPNSGLGHDPLTLEIRHTDELSGKKYSDIQETSLDSLYITTPSSPVNLEIQYLQLVQNNVNQGQSGIGAQVRIKNMASNPVQMDSVYLIPDRGGINWNRVTPLVNIPGNSSQLFNFSISIDDTTSPGPLALDAGYFATDIVSDSGFSSIGASLVDTLNILIPAELVNQNFSVDPGIASEGQTEILAFGYLRNTGMSAVQITDLELLIDEPSAIINSTLLSPAPLPKLFDGDSVQVVFNLSIPDPSSFYGNVGISLRSTGQDLTDSLILEDTSNVGDILVIQSRGQIIIDSVRSNLSTITPGQTNIPIRAYFHNPGQAGINLTNAELFFSGSKSHFSQTYDSVQVNPFSGPNIAYFTVGVLNNAPIQQYPITSRLTGTEFNTGNVESTTSVAAQGDTLTIIEQGRLRALSVNSGLDSVSIGSDEVPLSVKIKNTGSAGVLVDTVKLTFSQGVYLSTDTSISPPLILQGNEVAQIGFLVDIPAVNSPLISTLNAQVFGRDIVSGTLLSDLGADTTDSWRLVTPAEFTFRSIIPDSVSIGQNLTFEVEIENIGQANARYTDSLTFLDFNGSQITASQSGLIRGNNTALVNFDPWLVGISPGLIDGALTFQEYEENGFNKTAVVSSVEIVVLDSARLVVDSITADDTISQDMNFNMLLALRNFGSSNADAIIDSVVINEFGFSQEIGLRLTADDTVQIPIAPYISTSFAGDVNFVVQVYWRDVNLNNSNVSTISNQVNVLRKAEISITQINYPTLISRGQSGISVDVSIFNSGEVTALIDHFVFVEDIGLYNIDSLPPYQNILPGETVVYYFTFDVLSNSAVGSDSIRIFVSGRDEISGSNIQINSGYEWGIEPESDVQIVSVNASKSMVSRGQVDVPVSVIINNQGGETARIDSVKLRFSTGDTNYINISRGNLNLILDDNDQDTVIVDVSISENAIIGFTTIDASAFGITTISGDTINIPSSNTKGFWTVQQRPQLEVPSLSINGDTVSTGQNNLVLNFQLGNNGGLLPTATANIDSIHLVINGLENDSSQFKFSPQFSTPISLANNSNLLFNYQLSVRDSAFSGQYDFAVTIYYQDLNDGQELIFPSDSSSSSTLTVQQKGRLSISNIQINPDSAYLGQNNVVFIITAKNVGEADVQLNSANLILHEANNFAKSLQTLGFPFRLSQNDSVDVLYLVNVPSNITIPQFNDSLIYAGGVLQGSDLNSGEVILNQSDSLNYLTVVNPADIEFVDLNPSGPFANGESVTFNVELYNQGGSLLYLNENTRLRFVKVDDPSTFISIPIDTLLSDKKIFPDSTSQLVFEDRQLTQTGDFQLIVIIEGQVHQNFYSETINTQAIVTVGGNISVQLPQVNPDEVYPDQENVQVTVTILNRGLPLGIDSLDTYIEFKYTDNNQLLPVLSTRVDGLDSIAHTPPAVILEWVFRVPVDARTGDVNVTAFLSLNQGTVVPLPVTNSFTIISGVDVYYVNNSLQPDSVVTGQNVGFAASFFNRGNTNLILNPDSSYLEFSDGMNVFKAEVNGNYSIPGTLDSIPDTSVVIFRSDTVSSSFNTSVYSVSYHLAGTLPNGDPFEGWDTTAANQIVVLSEADVRIDSIDIVPDVVVSGQTGVTIHYYLKNSGDSPALVFNMNSLFEDSLGSDISNQWTALSQTPQTPFIINENDTLNLARKFNVSPSIDPGIVKTFMNGQYSDMRKPMDSNSIQNSITYDSVEVIAPSSIFVDSLLLTNVPNAANGTVNWGQNYDLKLVLQNFGQDAVQDVVVELLENNFSVRSDSIAGPVLAGTPFESLYTNLTAGVISETRQYRAVILAATSVVTGTQVTIEQPRDNIENVIIQRPSVLTLSGSASDSTLSQTQEFQVQFNIDRLGISPIGNGEVRINLPFNYNLASSTPNPLLSINSDTLQGFWNVIATGLTSGVDDTIKVDYMTVPIDLNTGNSVQLNNQSASIPVRTMGLGTIEVTDIAIIFPQGAQDNTLSTGQLFNLRAKFEFNGNVLQTGRTAELTLPEGQGFLSDPPIQILTSDSAIWQIRAPDSLLSTSVNSPSGGGKSFEAGGPSQNLIDSILDKLFHLTVEVHALESNTGEELANKDSLQVSVQIRAELQLSAEIVSPSGAIDGILSTNQAFDILVWVDNIGEAQTAGTNQIKIKVPSGFRLQSSSSDSLIISVLTGYSNRDSMRIFAPDTISSFKKSIQSTLTRAATDVNSNNFALIEKSQDNISVNVVAGASLSIDSLRTNQAILTPNQNFVVTTNISNKGTAAVIPDDSVWVELDFDPNNFQLSGNENVRKGVKLINNSARIFWNLMTTFSPNLGIQTISATIDSTVSMDINTDSLVNVENATAQTDVEISDPGNISINSLIFEQNSGDSITVSTDQAGILLEMKAHLNPIYLANAIARLNLPPGSGFTTDSSLNKNIRADSTVNWRLTAPSQMRGWLPFVVEIEAISPINPEIVLTDSDSVHVEVIDKANLFVSGRIIAPVGATDNSVSYGQTLTYEVVVNNNGDANVLSPPEGPQGSVEISLGNLLMIDGASTAVKDFSIGDPIQWQIRVDSSSLVAIILKQIKQIEKQSIINLSNKISSPTKQNTALVSENISKKSSNIAEDRHFDNSSDYYLSKVQQAQITELYNQLNSIIDSSFIQVVIKTIPFDENTGDSAFIGKRFEKISIAIEEEPFINIPQWQVRQVWSTNQIDTIEAFIFKPENVDLTSAKLILPNGFKNLGSQILQNSVKWTVQSPPNIAGQPDLPVSINIAGVDQNSRLDTVMVTKDTLIALQKEAVLSLFSDQASRRVSKNEQFPIDVFLQNSGEAGISGTGILEIIPGEMILANGETNEKTFTSISSVIRWYLVAPDSNVNTLVTVRFKQRPLDANKVLPVSVNPDSSTAVIDINMIPKRLVVGTINEISPAGSYPQGTTEIGILGLTLSNLETIKADTILVNQFLLSFLDPQNNTELIQDLSNLISRIRVLNLASNPQFNKNATAPSVFADMVINPNTPNPVPIDFTVLDTITSGNNDSLVITIDIAEQAPNRNFMMGVEDIDAFQYITDEVYEVDVTDSVGNPIQNLPLLMQSRPISIVSSDPQQVFGNYPNPFGLSDQETNFVFFMEDGGNVDLRIYTLLGELVWNHEENGLERGLYDGKIKWNGYNNIGNQVLNGVYFALIKVEYENGNTVSYKTKIAFIK